MFLPLRCWVIINKEGRFRTLRHFPKLVKLTSNVREEEDGTTSLILIGPDMETVAIPQPSDDQPVCEIK